VEFSFAIIYSLWLCFYPHIYEQQFGNSGGLEPASAIMTYDSSHHLNTYLNYGKAL
jgi:hypothetical protein